MGNQLPLRWAMKGRHSLVCRSCTRTEDYPAQKLTLTQTAPLLAIEYSRFVRRVSLKISLREMHGYITFFQGMPLEWIVER
jgi:hypothetical protein